MVISTRDYSVSIEKKNTNDKREGKEMKIP